VTIFSGLVIMIIAVAIAIGGQLLVRRANKHSEFKNHHDVADPMLSIVGTLFAVLLGFMVANAMTRFEEARITVQQEANAVMDLFRISEGIPDTDKTKLRQDLQSYVRVVINDEWPRMAHKESSQMATDLCDKIWSDCATFKPKEDCHNNLQQKMLDTVSQLSDARRVRLYAMHNGLPISLWVVLFAGGIATLSFTYLFGIKSMRLQVLMTAIVSVVICLNMFLLASFDDPFSGDVMVHPSAFQLDLDSMARKSAQK